MTAGIERALLRFYNVDVRCDRVSARRLAVLIANLPL